MQFYLDIIQYSTESLQPWKALTEIRRCGDIVQKQGAWREQGRNAYHVSDLFRDKYEQQFFHYIKG